MKKCIASDIDGTLLSHGNLIPEVYPFFARKEVEDVNLVFVTGNWKNVAEALFEQVVEKFPHLKNVKPYYATINGSVIYAPDGTVIKSRSLEKTKLKNTIEKMLQLFPGVHFFLSDETNALMSHIGPQEWLDFCTEYEKSQKMKGKIGLPIKCMKNSLNEIIDSVGDLFGLNVIYDKCDDVIEFLRNEYKDYGYNITYDSTYNMIFLSASTKWKALNKIFDYEHSKPTTDFVEHVEDFWFFGDGGNDIECLQNCKNSVARGHDLRQDVIDNATYYVDDMTEISKVIFEQNGGKYIEIRPAERSELNDVAKLSQHFAKEECCNGIVADDSTYFADKNVLIALDNKRIIAYAYGTIEEKEKTTTYAKEKDKVFYLEEIYVEPKQRSLGIGKRMFNQLRDYAKDNGCKAIEVSANSKNYKSILKFYIEELDMKFWNAFLYKEL